MTAVTPDAMTGPGGLVIDLGGSRKRHASEFAVKAVLTGAVATTVLITVGILWTLADETYQFLSNIDTSSLWADGWYPRRGKYGLGTLFWGTFASVFVGLAVAIPAGLGTAVYLSEYAPPRLRSVIKPAVEVLAGIPSVVVGFFALSFISPTIVQSLIPGSSKFNIMSAGLGIGLLVTPLIATVAEDAIRAVPNALREASAGTGARKSTTTMRVVIPAAASGIVASVVLATSRAIGETMVVLLAAGGSGTAAFPKALTNDFSGSPIDRVNDLFGSAGQTITAAMGSLASGSDNVGVAGTSDASQAFNSLFFLGAVLFLITLVLNISANTLIRKVRNVY